MKKLLTLLLLISSHTSTFPKEWTIELNPAQLKMCSGKGLQRPTYFVDKCGIRNMVNLSFFNGNTFIPPYKDSTQFNYKNPKNWPIFTIERDGFPFIYGWNELSTPTLNVIKKESVFLASGYPLLLREGKRIKIVKSFFARRKCPRTAIGIHPNGSVVLYVTTAATLRQVQLYLESIGCIDAINLDGGSSTFLYLNGENVFSSNEGRSYPNVLYWE